MNRTHLALLAVVAALAGALALIATNFGGEPQPNQASPRHSASKAPTPGARIGEHQRPQPADTGSKEDATTRIEVTADPQPEPEPILGAEVLTVRGIVTDEDGKPIEGANLKLVASRESSPVSTTPTKPSPKGAMRKRAKNGKQWSMAELPKTGKPAVTTSAADGSFEVHLAMDGVEEPNVIVVHGAAFGFVTNLVTFAMADRLGIELRLTTAITIKGKVLTVSGAPIANTMVSTKRTYEGSVFTDAEGRFQMTGLDPEYDEHLVTAEAKGFVARGVVIEFPSGTTRHEEEIVIVLQGASKVIGTVVGGGGPVARAYLWFGSDKKEASGMSDESGAFAFEGLRPGTRTLHVGHSSFLSKAVTFEVPPAGGVRELTITLEKGRILTGLVVDMGGQPIAGVRVTAQLDRPPGAKVWNLRTAKSAEDGTYELSGLPDQDLTVGCAKSGFTAIAGVPAPRGVDYVPVTLQGEITLSGQVQGEDGLPVSKAWVSARRTDSNRPSTGKTGIRSSATRTDDEGAFELRQIGPGNWILVVAHPDCDVFMQPFQVPDGARTWEVKVQLHSQGTLQGIVKSPDGQFIPGARVQLHALDFQDAHQYSNATADASGQFSFSNLPTGHYELRHLEASEGSDGKSLWHHSMTVRVQGRATQNVVLIAPGSAVVRGTLRAPTSIPAKTYVQLVAVQDESTPTSQRIPTRWARATQGAFEFRSIEAGTFQLRCSAQGLQGTLQIELSDGGQRDVTLTLEAETRRD